METQTAVHSGRDSLDRPIEPGTYIITIDGSRQVVVLAEDPANGAIGSMIRGRWWSIEELDPRAVLSRIDNLTELPKAATITNIDAHLARARAFRTELARLEHVLADELGCVRGDGSPLWEGISAAVRDGMGTAVDLLDLSGGLRR